MNRKKRSIHSKYPSKVDPNLPQAEWRKARTLELYSYLPQTTLEERAQYVDVRDEVIGLNYGFFGYVASHVFLDNDNVSYEDKVQSALLNFCDMWHKYMFAEKYRTDLSFAVFFKPRLSECIRREFNIVKHSLGRSLKMEAADQLGLHYSKLTQEDLAKVDLPAQKMNSLNAIFNVRNHVDIEIEGEEILPTANDRADITQYAFSDNPVVSLLVNEMIEKERPLEMIDLLELSAMTGIPIDELDESVEEAKSALHEFLINSIDE